MQRIVERRLPPRQLVVEGTNTSQRRCLDAVSPASASPALFRKAARLSRSGLVWAMNRSYRLLYRSVLSCDSLASAASVGVASRDVLLSTIAYVSTGCPSFPTTPPTTAMDNNHYYHAPDLGRFAEVGRGAPELWDKFLEWYNAVFAEGALSAREKALIALAVSHAVQCPYCIDAYTTAALEQGSNEEQMTEAVHVAAAIRGGASLVHGVQMRNHLERLGM